MSEISSLIGNTKNINLLINSDMALAQRIGLAGTKSQFFPGYALDRWKALTIRTDITTTEANAEITHDTSTKPSRNVASMKAGIAGTVGGTNLYRLEQRLEGITFQHLYSNQLTMQVLLKRDSNLSTSMFDTKVYFVMHEPSTKEDFDSSNNSLDVDGATQVLTPVKEGTVLTGDLTLNDVDQSAFKRYFATFNVPTNPEKGLLFGVWLRRPEGNEFETGSYVNMANAAVHEGPSLLPYVPTGQSIPGFELQLAQRYFEKSYKLDVAPGTATTDNATRMQLSSALLRHHSIMLVEKRAEATTVIYSPDTGNSGKYRDINAGADRNASSNAGTKIFKVESTENAGSTENQVRWHWTADAEL